ncbi:MAG: hypothetical protein NC399_09370 [Muribaculum sp.]|nr:hypothetical protein [Muribaculum sp.]
MLKDGLHQDDENNQEQAVQNPEPERPPFTRWLTFGNHMYRRAGERCDVEFIDNRLGIRKTIVDNRGNILDFPGIERGKWMECLESENCLRPVVQFRTDFQKYDDQHYIMIWEVQPDGRYWEDSDGFGGTSDMEVCLYALIDHAGCFTGPFRIYRAGAVKYIDTE